MICATSAILRNGLAVVKQNLAPNILIYLLMNPVFEIKRQSV
jgi:hypothetical protein